MNKKVHTAYVEKSNLRGLMALFGDWLGILIIIWVSIQLDSLWVYLLSVWLIGSLQFAIGEALLHEASHNHLFKSIKLNHYLSIFYTLPFFYVFSDYKKEHFAHHKFLGNAEKDHIAHDYLVYGLEKSSALIVWFIKPLLGVSGYYYALMVKEKIQKYPLQLLTFWAMIFTLFYFLSAISLLIYYWFIPLFWCFASFLYWSEVSDHYRTQSGTRSDMSWIKNFMHHNNGYHALHHKYAEIPWYLLPEAYEEIKKVDPSIAIDVSSGFLATYQQIKKKI